MTGPTCQRHGIPKRPMGKGGGRLALTCHACRMERQAARRVAGRHGGYDDMGIAEMNRRLEIGMRAVRERCAARVRRLMPEEIAELNRQRVRV